MKKLISFLMPLLLIASMAIAQQHAVKTTKTNVKATTKTEVSKANATATKAAPVKPNVKASVTKAGNRVKADGTPDMRYKANKTVKTVAGPTKKDGTPDMRYKANKK